MHVVALLVSDCDGQGSCDLSRPAKSELSLSGVTHTLSTAASETVVYGLSNTWFFQYDPESANESMDLQVDIGQSGCLKSARDMAAARADRWFPPHPKTEGLLGSPGQMRLSSVHSSWLGVP